MRASGRGQAGTPPTVVAGQQGVTDHGALTGLADDDHPQYTTAAEALAPVTAHEADTTGVHGIADTAALTTSSSVTAAIDARLSAANALDLTDGGPTTLHTHAGGSTAVPVGIPPAGALGQTYPRGSASGNFGVLSSGRLQLVGIWLPTGTTVTNVAFMSGTTAASSPTNQWFGLFDQNRVCLRLTANATTAAWAANATKSLALTAPFVTTYTGLHYLGVMVTATTVPTLTGSGVTAQMNALVPIAHGNSNTGQTTPPGLPFTAAALTGAANVPWGYVT